VGRSIRELPPLETGGTQARKGIGLQDHVAAKFCIRMLTGTDLQEVWCERHDDITLIWQTPEGELVEFVQVKGEGKDHQWSVPKLCKREKKPSSPNGVGTSVLERSLANDRGHERCQFRMVTSRPVHPDLQVLTCAVGSDYRTRVQEGIDAVLKLVTDISTKLGDFRSANNNDCAFWLKQTVWDIIHGLDAERNGNLLELERALNGMNEYPALDQREDLYLRILKKVWDAAVCDWQINPHGKRIVRGPFVSWFSQIVGESLYPMRSKGKMRRKMEDAHLPPDTIFTAAEQREMYRKVLLSPGYLDVKDRSLVEHEVLAILQDLRAQLDAGYLPNSGVQFHAECLSALKALQPKLQVRPKPSLSFLQGCMYSVADRCLHRFQR